MDKRLWFVALGALAVAGCKSDTVMGERYYVPAANPDPMVAPASKTVTGDEPIVTLPTTPVDQPAVKVAEYEPMTGVKSSGGVDSVAPAATAKGGVYVVQKGDTLGKIANKNGVKLADLMAANNLSERDAKRLQVGKKLTIPGGKVAAGSSKTTAKASKGGAEKAAVPAQLDSDGRYVVQSGDTPEKIARKNQVKLADLMKANGLDSDSAKRLQIGDKLIILGKSAAAPAATEVKPAEAKADETKTAITPALDATESTAAPVLPAEGAESNTKMVFVEEDSISLEDFAKKYKTTVEFLRANNAELESKTVLHKDEPVLVPAN